MNHALFQYALLAHCAFCKASMKNQISNNFQEDPEGAFSFKQIKTKFKMN